MSRISFGTAATSVGLIGLIGASVFFLFASDYYDLENNDSELVGAYGLEQANWEEIDLDQTVGATPDGVQDAVVLAQIDDDAWLVDLDLPDPDRVLVVTEGTRSPASIDKGNKLSADGRLTAFDEAELESRGIDVDDLHDAYQPDAVLWADTVEVR